MAEFVSGFCETYVLLMLQQCEQIHLPSNLTAAHVHHNAPSKSAKSQSVLVAPDRDHQRFPRHTASFVASSNGLLFTETLLLKNN
jgi:hypothetical protein